MKFFNQFFLFLIFIFLSFTTAYAIKSSIEPKYLVGGNFMYTLRTGSYLFKHLEMKQDTAQEKLLLGGFTLGRRYHILPWFRIQLSGIFDFGNTKHDSPVVENNYKNAGIDLDIHLVKLLTNTSHIFIICGGGLNRMYLQVKSPIYELDIKSSSANFTSGVGFEHTINREIMICFSYQFRFWRPVRYDERSDLPIETVTYQETFYSHVFKLDFLFNLFKE